MRTAILTFCFFSCSCSMRPLYAPLGAAIGGGAGSIAGPAGAAFGAGAGAATGSLLAGDQELTEAKDTITAITRGDAEALIAQAAGKNKGFIDEALDTLYGFIKICLVLLVLWNLIPIIYTRYVHRKQNGNPKKT